MRRTRRLDLRSLGDKEKHRYQLPFADNCLIQPGKRYWI